MQSYRHPYFPELEIVENYYGRKHYYISVDNLPEIPKQIYQAIENIKELQKNQYLSPSFRALLKSEIQILELKLKEELSRLYPCDVEIIPF